MMAVEFSTSVWVIIGSRCYVNTVTSFNFVYLCLWQDTDALLAAVSSGAVDVNFTDDVGQTLLNWAAAFGTREMVEFLCEKGDFF